MARAYPSLGAIMVDGGVRFRVWVPAAVQVVVVLEGDREVEMQAQPHGYFQTVVGGCGPGALYRYRVDGIASPDPASRFQPHGMHGPSMVIDPHAYRWRDGGWTGRPLDKLVFYEMHVGTFTTRRPRRGGRPGVFPPRRPRYTGGSPSPIPGTRGTAR